MKKRLLLGLLPISMVLAGCNFTPTKDTNKESFNAVEEADADDKDFLGAEIKFENNFDPVENNETPIGIQNVYEDGYRNIRFIAPIKVVDMNDDDEVTEEDLHMTTAVWHRQVNDTDGEVIKGEAEKPSKKAYTSLNAGLEYPYTIQMYNSEHGTEYTHFVTYALKHVEDTQYGRCYIVVSLTVNGEDSSKSLCTRIDDLTKFTFESDLEGLFGVKKNAQGMSTFQMPLLNKPENFDGRIDLTTPENPSDENYLFVFKDGSSFTVYGDGDISGVDYEREGRQSDFFHFEESGSYVGFVTHGNSKMSFEKGLLRRIVVRCNAFAEFDPAENDENNLLLRCDITEKGTDETYYLKLQRYGNEDKFWIDFVTANSVTSMEIECFLVMDISMYESNQFIRRSGLFSRFGNDAQTVYVVYMYNYDHSGWISSHTRYDLSEN